MNPSEDHLDRLLRHAPHPTAPSDLREQLLQWAPGSPRAKRLPIERAPLVAWFLRWRSALLASGLAAATLVVLGYQQMRLADLRATINELRSESAPGTPSHVPSANGTQPSSPTLATNLDSTDLVRLRTTVAGLKREVEALQNLRAENARLRDRIAAAATAALSAEDAEALQKARERAQSIACVNNLKQLALAVRIFATDHDDVSPPDYLSISNEIHVPKLLTCPADTARSAATSWHTLSPDAISYEYLAPGASADEPQRVLFRCPIHGSVALMDGSVQMGMAKNHPERFVERDGKLFMIEAPAPAPNPTMLVTPTVAVPGTVDPRMAQRHGLLPGSDSSTNPPTAPQP